MSKLKINNYIFNKTAKTVTFTDYTSIRLDEVLLITNVTNGIIIYNFADPNLGGTVTNNVLTLEYDTSSMSDSDSLLIYYDDPDSSQITTLTDVSVAILKALNALTRPMYLDPTTGRININNITSLPTLANVTTVGTTSDVTRLNNIGPNAASQQSALYVGMYGTERANWALSVRNNIS